MCTEQNWILLNPQIMPEKGPLYIKYYIWITLPQHSLLFFVSVSPPCVCSFKVSTTFVPLLSSPLFPPSGFVLLLYLHPPTSPRTLPCTFHPLFLLPRLRLLLLHHPWSPPHTWPRPRRQNTRPAKEKIYSGRAVLWDGAHYYTSKGESSLYFLLKRHVGSRCTLIMLIPIKLVNLR